MIHIFLESLKITGIKTINVPTIETKTTLKEALKTKKEITNAAVAKAIPTG
ncbi:hypothetical protein GCM10022395_05480 [Snuella lapsa]|uniref:Uncharacterized protein n=1 Tax=Snuella lapsa TaxID=870481 RepID=A0ABP6WVL7_9FLAO